MITKSLFYSQPRSSVVQSNRLLKRMKESQGFIDLTDLTSRETTLKILNFIGLFVKKKNPKSLIEQSHCVESVGGFRFQIYLYILSCIMSSEFTQEAVTEISTTSVSLNLVQMFSIQFYPFKDFLSDQIQRKSRKIVTTHYAALCRNTDLNFYGTTNQFMKRILWGVA